MAVQPLNFHPGESHAYGLSVDVLGRLVEVVSGQRLDVFFQERIFGPLGMKDTYFHVPDEKLSRLTTPYIWTRAAGLRPMEYAARDGNLLIGGEGYRGSNTYLSGGAGLISTARDYAQFLQMLLNSGQLDGIRILRSETVELMRKSHTDDLSPSPLGAGAGMGLGLIVSTSEPPAGTPGSMGNYTQPGIYGTTFWVDPRQELIGIVLVQRYPIGSLTIDDLFQALTYQAIVH